MRMDTGIRSVDDLTPRVGNYDPADGRNSCSSSRLILDFYIASEALYG
jgi:hypothetical protein